ncbi:MAG: lytic transglycosylase domain-containing protein, partial [Candidatus Dormibacteraeota bacterium]|nr:lytic transglycosylase domain-containing protein [Candidatus Dormibacteraeota bacterium]
MTAPSPASRPTELDRLVANTRTLEARGSRALDLRLVAAYAILRDARLPLSRRQAAARSIQLASAQLLTNQAWRASALSALQPADRASLQAMLEAGDELGAMGDPSDSLPNWRIAAPPPSAALLDHYHEAERASGIPWQYLAAINLVETAMGRIHGLSVAGAQGPMQFMPQTWEGYGRGDINDPRDSILAAARYLRARGGPADMDGALYGYNQSHHYVRAIDIFANQVAADPDAFLLYYSWQVLVPTTSGPALL